MEQGCDLFVLFVGPWRFVYIGAEDVDPPLAALLCGTRDDGAASLRPGLVAVVLNELR